MEKYLIIGDIHGCWDEFAELLKTTDWFKDQRTIVSVGDLLDKNPGTDNYVQLIKFFYEIERQNKFLMVLGNHEQKHLRFEERERKGNNKMAPAKYPESHKDFWDTRNQLLFLRNNTRIDPFGWFRGFPYHLYLYGYDVCVVHGGLERDKKPEQMSPDVVCRTRNLHPETGRMVHLSDISDETPFWTKEYKGETKVVFGHAPAKEPRIENNTYGLDTGCCYGFALTGLLLPEFKIVSVPAKKVYAESHFELD